VDGASAELIPIFGIDGKALRIAVSVVVITSRLRQQATVIPIFLVRFGVTALRHKLSPPERAAIGAPRLF
jgi:hypothetical protein